MDINARNALTSEVCFANDFNGTFFTAINSLMDEVSLSFTAINEILLHDPVEYDFAALNRIGEPDSVRRTHETQILFYGEDISSDVYGWNINYDEDKFCKDITISIAKSKPPVA